MGLRIPNDGKERQIGEEAEGERSIVLQGSIRDKALGSRFRGGVCSFLKIRRSGT